MKHLSKSCVAIVTLLFSSQTNAQTTDQPQTGDAFEFSTPFRLPETDQNGVAVPSSTSQSIPRGSAFNIVTMDNTNYTICFWNWSTAKGTPEGIESSNSKRSRLNFSDPAGTQRRFFQIPKTSFPGITKRIYKRFNPVLGVLAYPFKYYPQDRGKFDKSFSISMTGGYSYLIHRTIPDQSFAFTLGVGLSSITLNDKNSELTEDQELSAATVSLNLIYIHERLQLALSFGTDKLIGGNDNGWNRDGNLWLGFGVGVNIFTIHKPSTETEGEQP